MAAPQRRYRASVPARPVARPAEKYRGWPGAAARRKAIRRRRRFAVIVVVPVLLMLGSVYLHTLSAEFTDKAAVLEARLARAEAEGKRLEVRATELSGARRIRSLAAEKLGMRDPRATDLEVYDGEDGTQDGGEERGGKPR